MDHRQLHYDFLSTDADLANTFLQTFDLERVENPEHAARLLRYATVALATIRRLINPAWLTPEQHRTILERCDKLEGQIEVRRHWSA